MTLSIKNEKAEQLAKALAKEPGSTITDAVIRALEEAMLREKGRRRVPSVRDAVLGISERCAALPDLDARPPDEILGYNSDGGFD